MKITIIGTGYVGLVTGACLAELGNNVFCLDVDQSKIDILNNGGIPIHEPGLEDVVARNRAAGRLTFSTDVAASVAHGDVQFIAVGTPPDEDGSADLQYVLAAARNIGKHMTGFKVIVDKSTVPVGTAGKVSAAVAQELQQRGNVEAKFSVVSNPEFLKEGAAVEDFMRPDRIVIGHDNTAEGMQAYAAMKKLYAPFNRNHERTYWMDVRSAEFTKYAANAMLATRISFMNELANLADQVGADIEAVRHGIGSDPRIGHSFLYAGCGYGGSCFPKDVQALERTARAYGQELHILRAVEQVNNNQKHVLGNKIVARFGENLQGRHFAVWGLAFKPNTDDMREASSRVLLGELIARGATVAVFDPVAMKEARRVLALDFNDDESILNRIRFSESPMDALQDADALAIVTEWKAFRSPDFDQLKSKLKAPVIFDGRNLFEPQVMADAGIEYHGIGRSILTKS
ncbi:UDP-glucose/GDP-mannose dehydrogenase family protein [Herbaspirillum lusitanum]|uniref:UDP-glucose dehydrogenase family protein n=1 Tax=Herbaspirillum lusitanum TaxID=213312 RepID=UPI00223860B0|nr:UDP-glucose/GDP-mannose dehydrogenase family protein [Herbaspirillum lusitanum]MCW5298006.1 UDP-glucose/GDP-mannose dehydrogenase family protein [Herbaspirillum lusitanum]